MSLSLHPAARSCGSVKPGPTPAHPHFGLSVSTLCDFSGLRKAYVSSLMWYHSTVHSLFQDDLASVSISRLRASGVVTSDMRSVNIVFGEGDDGLARGGKVVHRRFPNGGSWSFYVCPACKWRASSALGAGEA
jgi:hypothetical protein